MKKNAEIEHIDTEPDLVSNENALNTYRKRSPTTQTLCAFLCALKLPAVENPDEAHRDMLMSAIFEKMIKSEVLKEQKAELTLPTFIKWQFSFLDNNPDKSIQINKLINAFNQYLLRCSKKIRALFRKPIFTIHDTLNTILNRMNIEKPESLIRHGLKIEISERLALEITRKIAVDFPNHIGSFRKFLANHIYNEQTSFNQKNVKESIRRAHNAASQIHKRCKGTPAHDILFKDFTNAVKIIRFNLKNEVNDITEGEIITKLIKKDANENALKVLVSDQLPPIVSNSQKNLLCTEKLCPSTSINAIPFYKNGAQLKTLLFNHISQPALNLNEHFTSTPTINLLDTEMPLNDFNEFLTNGLEEIYDITGLGGSTFPSK
ncbi:MAG: hypothetical protein H2069_01960 [Legionella sp.]|nr:hypothetical protein [Legionella sp.]